MQQHAVLPSMLAPTEYAAPARSAVTVELRENSGEVCECEELCVVDDEFDASLPTIRSRCET